MLNRTKTNKISKNISPEHLQWLKKIKQRQFMIHATRIVILVVFIVLWEIAGHLKIIDPFITSQPSRIWKTLVTLHHDGSLYTHTFITTYETIIGFILGTLLGTVVAILMWWSSFLTKVLDPYLVVLNSLPKTALGPIIIVWVGAGQPAIIVMALFISFVVTILGVLSGFLEVDEDKIKLLKTFGATKMQILTKVVLPASVPTIISALKINVGLSWVGVIVGEFLVSKAGLGYLIVYGGQVFKLDLVMTSVIILAIIAALMYQGVAWVESRYLKWRQ
ncbi:MAG: NitT/TauT family transport system permease protein [Clostridiales bacterium]|jgi:NitT/TauT family transport system permease protein|nr:NitT/TauT family transport system permease protein [Clostridiales bacterium]MDK2934597.1 NitT/TauT family transport system permease protein [Clostridiales bacterium]